ncbi:TonB-dependent receptor plug domain-containing protein [Seonamhaeicola maritimus]|uniref:TonB-dependent receptor plug domain-containing protein n=1 Tax=Seonamhaeicola maritimus TaxID=2591822 RepID=UPI001F4FAF73|nr:TonB-dependent receptor plug domain-containing protein [Seonamhaeicola maritimus]
MKLHIALWLCVSSICISYSQIKQDTINTKTTQLPEVIVTGNSNTDPTHSTVKNDYQKKGIQPKNVADLFSEINGFSTIKRGNYAIDPTFRASAYEQLNVMYDGGTKAVHACPNRMDPVTTHVIPEEIEKIEVVKGPYTVRYGATFGGIINMVTKDPNKLDKGFHGKASAGYETNGNALVNLLQLQHVSNKFNITGNIGYRDFDDYEDGQNTTIPSAFRSTDYGLKLGYNLTDNQYIQGHWRQSFGRDIKHVGLPMDTEFDNSTIVSLDYRAEDISNTLKGITAKGFYSYVDHLMTNENRANFNMVFASSPVTSTTIGGKLETHWLFNNNVNLYVGTDANLIGRDGTRTRTIKMMNGNMLPNPMVRQDKIWQDASLNDIGVFSEAKYQINKTTFTAGLRLDFVNANAVDLENDFASIYGNDVKQSETNISGTLSLKHNISSNTIMEVAYGRGVRTANMAERFINHFTVGQDSYEYLGNPLLKPEINNQFEIGFQGHSKLNELNNFSYQLSAFYSVYNNYISAVVDTSIPRKFMPMLQPQFTKVFTNIDNAYKTGLEFMFKFELLEDYYFQNQSAYVRTKNKDFGESLPLNPPFTSTFSIGVDKENYWAKAQYNITSKQSHIAPSFGETETAGYETLDVKLGATLFKNITLGVACLNVFDETYSNHLNFSYRNQPDFNMSPITEPGRNFTAFLQYKF